MTVQHLTHFGALAGVLEMPGAIVLKELKSSDLTLEHMTL